MAPAPDTPPAQPASPLPGRRPQIAAAIWAAPAALAVGLALVEAWRERGSIDAAHWLSSAIVGALVLAAVAASGAARAPTRRVAAAAACLAGLAAWDAASLLWSPTPELARNEALLTALYAVALLIPAISLRRPVDRVFATAVVVAGLGALAVATAVELVRTSSVDAVYIDGRLDFPISYPNAEAALCLVGLWPALALAARKTSPALGRALALGAAAALAAGWLLAQSKGGGLGIAVSTVVVFAVHRGRLRLVAPVAIVAALEAIAFYGLTQPYRALNGDELGAIHHAGKTALAVTGAAFVAGLVYALVDRRISLSEATTRRVGHAALLAVVASVATGGSVFYAAHRDPPEYVAAHWQSFKHVTPNTGTSHFGSLGSNRYDFWRVALDEFRAHPLAGIGSRGFRNAYIQNRRSIETPARAHSVELDALSETGIVGFVLLALGLALACASFAGRARDDLVALGALGAFSLWLAHASVDWTWTFPSVGVPLFVLLGAAAAAPGRPVLRPRAGLPLAAAAAVLALAGFGLPWLSSRYVSSALAGSPNAAADLDRARSLDPLSVDPLLARWALAPTPRAGIAPLFDALRLEPRSPDLWFELGRQYLRAGDRLHARIALRRAMALDPHDEALVAAYRAARG
jgi:hypothetical protein